MQNKFTFLIFGLLMLLARSATAQIYSWAQDIGGNAADNQQILCSAIDNQGNIIVGGMFSGTVDFAPTMTVTGGNDIKISSSTANGFIAKYRSEERRVGKEC